MKKNIKLSFVAIFSAALILIGCSNDFTGTTLDSSAVARSQQMEESSNYGGATLSAVVTAVVLDANVTTAQEVVITFYNGIIDEATLGAVEFYPLTATAQADGAYTRGTALAYTTEVRNTATTSVVSFLFTFASNAGISDQLEIYIDPTVLTADNGSTMLNLDGDNVQGEALDDDFISYNITTSNFAVTAAGNPRNPRFVFSPSGGTDLTIAGDTTTTMTFATPTSTNKASLDAVYSIEKFNPLTGIWEEALLSSTTYDGTTGVYSVVLTAATKLGEVYRHVYSNVYDLQELVSVDGYKHRASYDQANVISYSSMSIAGSLVEFNTIVSYTATIDYSNGKAGIITIDVASIGLEGIDPATVTVDNLKVFDIAGIYVPWISATVRKSDITSATQKNDQIVLKLNSSYAPGNTLKLYIGPGLMDLGDTTAVTDDLRLGDPDNISVAPLGFNTSITVGGV